MAPRFLKKCVSNLNDLNSLADICHEIFPNASGFSFKKLSGGATNILFKVMINDENNVKDSTANNGVVHGNGGDIDGAGSSDSYPKVALLRVNGKNSEQLVDRDKEIKCLIELSKLNLGPQLYGTFLNGIIYQYFDGTPLSLDQMAEERNRKRIAQYMAKWHSVASHQATILPTSASLSASQTLEIQNAILAKKYQSVASLVVIFDTILKWIQEIQQKEYLKSDNHHPNLKSKIEKICSLFNPEQYIHDTYLLKNMTKNYPVSYCHNDVNALNIIYDEKKDEYHFIDFEYCDYNFRAFDIANHFCEYTGMSNDISRYPSKEQQLHFLQVYLEYCSKYNDQMIPPSLTDTQLLDQVRVCAALSSLYWGLWAIIQCSNSTIEEYDFFEYCEKRLQWYLNLRGDTLGGSSKL